MIYDISAPLREGMEKYPALRDFEFRVEKDYSKGDTYKLSAMSIQMHVGTHIDSPLHFIRDGKSIGELDLSIFYGEAAVIDTQEQNISAGILSQYEIKKRVLFRTNRKGIITEDGAQYLVRKNVIFVGLDSFSVDQRGVPNKIAHNTLLGAGIPIMEGADFSKVEAGIYKIICFPLNIEQAEASPCRAVLMDSRFRTR